MKNRIYNFYYADDEHSLPLIRIRSNRKPSIHTRPRSGTWVVRELVNGKWIMPCFPEITWGRLKEMFFVRKETDQ